jgi:hypothetical protein
MGVEPVALDQVSCSCRHVHAIAQSPGIAPASCGGTRWSDQLRPARLRQAEAWPASASRSATSGLTVCRRPSVVQCRSVSLRTAQANRVDDAAEATPVRRRRIDLGRQVREVLEAKLALAQFASARLATNVAGKIDETRRSMARYSEIGLASRGIRARSSSSFSPFGLQPGASGNQTEPCQSRQRRISETRARQASSGACPRLLKACWSAGRSAHSRASRGSDERPRVRQGAPVPQNDHGGWVARP